jgi:hypothetical protein
MNPREDGARERLLLMLAIPEDIRWVQYFRVM